MKTEAKAIRQRIEASQPPRPNLRAVLMARARVKGMTDTSGSSRPLGMILPRVRFTVRRMMIAVAVAAVMAIYLTPDGLFARSILSGLMLASAGYLLARDRRRWSVRAFGISAVSVNIVNAIFCVYYQDMLGGSGNGPRLILRRLLGPRVRDGLGDREARWGVAHRLSLILACLLVPTLAGAPTTMLLTAWPHRLAFLASQPALDRLADQVAAGQAPRRPMWAGVYLVVTSATDAKTGNVALIINSATSGRSGFLSDSAPPHSPNTVARFTISITTHTCTADGGTRSRIQSAIPVVPDPLEPKWSQVKRGHRGLASYVQARWPFSSSASTGFDSIRLHVATGNASMTCRHWGQCPVEI